ncbi:MAG: hypothetical protein GY778_12115, partial [bacterium]|nr:hypothetical protein [bacterium]
MLRRSFSFMLALAFPALAADPPFTTSKPAPAVEDFSFIHISDIHIEPHLARTGPPGSGRGADTIRWICREAGGPQNIAGVATPVTA